MSAPPTRVPTATDLLNHLVVRQALAQAWLDSLPNDPIHRHEEGGWIYLNVLTGDIEICRESPGQRSLLDLGNPPILPDCIIVGTFHTHPNPSSAGWFAGPSRMDQANAQVSGVPWLIRSDSGDCATGPNVRRGGMGGGPLYPP